MRRPPSPSPSGRSPQPIEQAKRAGDTKQHVDRTVGAKAEQGRDEEDFEMRDHGLPAGSAALGRLQKLQDFFGQRFVENRVVHGFQAAVEPRLELRVVLVGALRLHRRFAFRHARPFRHSRLRSRAEAAPPKATLRTTGMTG
jgi:hypothetical protein